MNQTTRAGLTSLETQRNHWGLQRSPGSNHRAREEGRGLLTVMTNAPTALRAYFLADAALVRGKLTLPSTPALKADRRFGFAQAAALQRGESSSDYFQVLRKGGFTSEQIAENIGRIALSTFSHYFAHEGVETVA